MLPQNTNPLDKLARWEQPQDLYEILIAERRQAKVFPSPYFPGCLQTESANYSFGDMGEGMSEASSVHSKAFFLMNDELHLAWMVMDADGMLAVFDEDDIDFEKVDELENVKYVHNLEAVFGFDVDEFKNGVSLVHWEAYPDGQYFADEDGFGWGKEKRVDIYAYIDKECRVLVPFQPMDEQEQMNYRQMAEEMVGKR